MVDNTSLSLMADDHTSLIQGIKVHFPFKPYRSQRQVMMAVLKALNLKQNALLESPTGTGKTLALLCAVLAWQQHMRAEDGVAPRIYYCTRTHAQIAQVVGELERTPYRPSMSILAARDHMCINQRVKAAPSCNGACRKAVANKKCVPYFRASQLVEGGSFRPGGAHAVWDIEDFVAAGCEADACPYYAARALAENADIVFCPYNYLISATTRKAMGIDLTNAIVIIDEGHNIESAARDAASATLTDADLRTAHSDLSGDEGATHLCKMLGCILEWLKTPPTTTVDVEATVSEWRAQAAMMETLRSEFQSLSDDDVLPERTAVLLENLLLVLDYINGYDGRFTKDFAIVVERTDEAMTLQIACLNPAVAFGALTVAHSVLLTSGTLAPLDSFASELGTSFPVSVQAAHVIDAERQVFAGVLPAGVGHRELTATFENTSKDAFVDDLGATILALCREIPAGVLVFLSSYALLTRFTTRWKANGTWTELGKIKHAFVEPRGRAAGGFDAVLGRYRAAVADPGARTGAVLFAVFRGKASEGMNFADDDARGVIAVGIPYPNVRDPVVMAKRAYNDARRAGAGPAGAQALISGGDWYALEAYRALNQALGRCIRSRHDYGAIILIDARFNQARNTNSISRWVLQRLMLFPDATTLLEQLRAFTATFPVLVQ